MITIDIDSVARRRLGHKSRWLPRWVTSLIASIIRQDDLNGILARTDGTEGATFARAMLDDLNITYTPGGTLPDPTRRNVIIVANHPLGALDGITLIDWATRHYGHDVKFLVNDLLMAVTPLKPVFVPVNKFGRQCRDTASGLNQVLTDTDTPLIIFPAGMCSRLIDKNITDLPWKKTFISRAIDSQRDIIPLHFHAKNSTFFYKFAKLRQKLLPKVNLDMALLPREIFNSRGRHFTFTVGTPIAWQSLNGGNKAADEALNIRRILYRLGQHAPQK